MNIMFNLYYTKYSAAYGWISVFGKEAVIALAATLVVLWFYHKLKEAV